jgi:hypothetical protein
VHQSGQRKQPSKACDTAGIKVNGEREDAVQNCLLTFHQTRSRRLELCGWCYLIGRAPSTRYSTPIDRSARRIANWHMQHVGWILVSREKCSGSTKKLLGRHEIIEVNINGNSKRVLRNIGEFPCSLAFVLPFGDLAMCGSWSPHVDIKPASQASTFQRKMDLHTLLASMRDQFSYRVSGVFCSGYLAIAPPSTRLRNVARTRLDQLLSRPFLLAVDLGGLAQPPGQIQAVEESLPWATKANTHY